MANKLYHMPLIPEYSTLKRTEQKLLKLENA